MCPAVEPNTLMPVCDDMRMAISRSIVALSLAAMLTPQLAGATILLHSAVGSSLQLAGVADCPAAGMHDGLDPDIAMFQPPGESEDECCVQHDCACGASPSFALMPAGGSPAAFRTGGPGNLPTASMPPGTRDSLLRPPRP